MDLTHTHTDIYVTHVRSETGTLLIINYEELHLGTLPQAKLEFNSSDKMFQDKNK